MKLLYFYTNENNDFRNIDIHLTSEYIFKTNVLSDGMIEIEIEKNNEYIKNFFHEKGKIEIAGIIGKNGVGKTRTLQSLMRNIGEFGKRNPVFSKNIIYIFEEENEKKLVCFHNMGNDYVKISSREITVFSLKDDSEDFTKNGLNSIFHHICLKSIIPLKYLLPTI